MRRMILSGVFASVLSGCLSAPAPVIDNPGGSGGNSSSSGGSMGSGGVSSGSGGAPEGTGGSVSTNSGGSPGTGGVDNGSGGSSASGGAQGSGGLQGSGGSASGGITATGGATGSGGRGGSVGTGGASETGGRGGAIAAGGAPGSGGANGSGGSTSACAVLDGLRVDDACGNLQSGNACLHKGKTTDDGTPFSAMKAVTMGGTSGTTYQVKLHFRGVVEPTHIMSGTVGTPTNFITGGARFQDGSQESTYQQWRITTTNPNQHYYLNAYNSTGLAHVVKLIDYSETIPIAAGATVTLDIYDGNAHEISNTVDTPPLAPSGIPGSMNSGQFMQVNVDGCN